MLWTRRQAASQQTIYAHMNYEAIYMKNNQAAVH